MRLLALLILGLSWALPACAAPSYYAKVHPVWAGYGPEPIDGQSYHAPRAYALAATAYARDGLLDDARRAADWLVSNADLDGDGLDGWGFAYPADAFGDGTINPEHTAYGITTAVAALALMDVHQATGEEKYLEAAVSALEDYALFSTDGVFAYSSSPHDRTAVYNITATMMGALARAARLAGRGDLQRLADRSFSYLMGIAHDEDAGTLWWGYGDHKPGRQDLKHAAYMVTGLIDYQAPAGMIAKAVNELRNFHRGGQWYNRVDSDAVPAEVKGLAKTLTAACRVDDGALASTIMPALSGYRVDGHYVNLPGETNFAPRHQLAVAAALAACD